MKYASFGGMFVACVACGGGGSVPTDAGADAISWMDAAEADPASSATSSFTANPSSVPADGVATITLTVTVRDDAGNPLSGHGVTLAVSGSSNVLSPATGTTAADGTFTATLASTIAGTKTATATFGPANASTQVEFVVPACNGTLLLPDVRDAPLVGQYMGNLTVGDFNGDGTPDVAGTDSISQTLGVALGSGKGLFKPAVMYSSYAGPIAHGDFNGDAKADLVTLRGNLADLAVLLSNGDGTFSAKGPFKPGVAASMSGLAVGDFNGDGRLDVATASQTAVGILLGNGNGTLQPGVGYAAGSANSYAALVAVGDLNGDGKLDVVTENTGNNVSVLLGNGNGSFKAPVNYTIGSTPNYQGGLAIAEVNGDGKLDIVAAYNNAGTVYVLLGNGNGTLQPAVTYATGDSPRDLTVADFDGDSMADIAVTGSNVGILFGKGAGTFDPPTIFAFNTYSLSIATEDMNADARADIVVCNGNAALPLLLQGTRTFSYGASYDVGSYPYSLAVADFNGDSVLDAVAANSGGADLSVLLGVGDGTLHNATSYNAHTNPQAVIATDLNGDGKVDLAAANSGSTDVSVLFGKGNGTFDAPANYQVGGAPYALVVADFNNDLVPDLATVNGSMTVSVLVADGIGSYVSAPDVNFGASSWSFVASDLNSDGKADLVVSGYDSKDMKVLLGNGDGTFQPVVSIPIGSFAFYVGAGDLNRDGKSDVVVTRDDGKILVWIGNGDGTFHAGMSYPAGFGGNPLIGDLDADGNVDILVGSVFLRGNGDGSFQALGGYVLGDAPTLADLNGDGRLDIATTLGENAGRVRTFLGACRL